MKQIIKDEKDSAAYLDFLARGKMAGAGLILGDRSSLRATVDKDTGFLTAPVKLARIGVQDYYGFELGLDDRKLDVIGVFRSPEEVFSPDSIASFVNLVVTDDHPQGFINTDNVKKLQKGSVSNITQNDDGLKGLVTVTDKAQIDKMKGGKVEVSVGYSNDLKSQKGVYDGKPYEYIQTNIKANHLAIVDAGRCGPACKITIDNKGVETVRITIDGIEYDVEDKQLAQAIQKQQASFDAEKEFMKKEKTDMEAEKEEMEKKKDKAEATADALKKSTLDDAAINAMVTERATLIAAASEILGDAMPECSDCPREIRAAVVDKILDMGDLSAKSDDYLAATYDMAVEKFKAGKKSTKNLGDDFKTMVKDGKEITRDSARTGYIKTLNVQ